MKLIKTFENFTSKKDPKDVKIEKLKDKLKNETTKVRQMKSSLNSIYTHVIKYKDFTTVS